MGEYNRVTRICSFEQFWLENRTAIQSYRLRYNLDLSARAILLCCETASEKKKKGLFGGEPPSYTSVVLTPSLLVWTVGSAKKTPVVLHVQLKDIEVRDFQVAIAGQSIQDSGVEILGVTNIDGLRGSVFLALGADADGEQFKQQLKQAALSAQTAQTTA